MDRFVAFTALIAITEARFGQENIPIDAISQVQGGDPGMGSRLLISPSGLTPLGAAATIAGAAISDLLAGTNACDKLVTADQIVAELGGGADAIAAALGMVAAEKNTNPFVVDVPSICSDPNLPATPELRGVTPLIDPDTANADVANALSAQSLTAPLDATGKSIADLLTENGFTDFTAQDSDGSTGAVADVALGAGNDTADAAATTVAAVQECATGKQ